MKQDVKSLKGLVIGCGSIGQRHIYNLKKIGIDNLAVFDIDKKMTEYVSKKYHLKKYYSLQSAFSFEPHFTFICTTPKSHIQLAEYCINANSHMFIEKPLSSNLSGVKQILQQADAKKLKISVGYNIRFDPGLVLLKKKIKKREISNLLSVKAEWGLHISKWQPIKQLLTHYVLKKGGGIILDDSHEYDYVRWIVDDKIKSVYCQTRQVKSPKTETESIAVIIIKFKKGVIANFFIDYVRPSYERKCQILGDNGEFKWEFKPGIRVDNILKRKAKSVVTTNLINYKKPKTNSFNVFSNNMYILEIENFIQSILKDKKPLVDGWEGLKTLEIGVAALESARKNKVIKL